MERLQCMVCHKNKTALRCDQCGDVSCKKCVHFIDEDYFEMITVLPDAYRNKTFCMNCFNQGIGEKIEYYRDVAEKAKDVDVFTKKQIKESRRIKRIEEPLRVTDCEDREEALMRLAFAAVYRGYDTLVDVDLVSKKIGESKSYKRLIWSGVGTPVDPKIKK